MKRILSAGLVLTLLLAAIVAVKIIGPNISWTDKNGFRHNVQPSEAISTDEPSTESTEIILSTEDSNDSSPTAVVYLDAESYDSVDKHTLINIIKPSLDEYSGKDHTTFVFKNGTGICFPFSDISQSAQYGPVDDNGELTRRDAWITIAGTQVTFEGSDPWASSESIDATNILSETDSRYINDALVACIDEGVLYVHFSVGAENVDAALQEAATVAKIYSEKMNMDGISAFYIGESFRYGYRVDLSNFMVEPDQSVLEPLLEKCDISDSTEY